MRLNQATDYAFRAILYMACLPPDSVVTGQTLSEQQNIPARFVLKVMHYLRKAGLVRSRRGADGGFYLALPAEKVSLYDVILAMEGSLSIHQCLADREACNRHCTDECPVHKALGQLQEGLVAGLRGTNFAALAKEYRHQGNSVLQLER